VTRYLLDTNIISNVIKPEPSQALLAWLGAQKDDDLFMASLTVAEIQRGIWRNRRGANAVRWIAVQRPEGPRALFAGRILSFDERAGLHWAHLMADGKILGRRRNALDMIIASIAAANDCVVVTDNERISRTSRL